MYLDGKKVGYTLGYVVTGSWNPRKPDYRRFKLTYQVPASLSVGTHTVKVTVHDLKSKNSTYTWKFNVDLPTAPATFASLLPTDGASSDANKPRISATVADRWDVKGTGSYSLSIDGVKVAASISYTTSGNYRAFRVWYQVASALSVGSHSVTVSVRDAAARTTSQTWSFSVIAPPPVYPEMPVEGARCADCHTGFPAAHPTSDCSGCHSADSPPRPANSIYAGTPMSVYTPANVSAHTLACSLESPCHGGYASTFPHTVGNDCTRCHNPSYPDIPQAHSVDPIAIKNLHASTPTFCTSTYCHSSCSRPSYRTDGGRTAMSCATCHASTNPTVIAAIANGHTACTDCHDLLDTHPDTTTAHAAVGTCVRSGCHSPSVTTIHNNNCMACHAAGKTPSTNCGNCHLTGQYHAGMTAAHTLSNNTCVAYGCHGVGIGMDAALTHKNLCTDCHNATATPSLNCVSCHTDSLIVLHAKQAASHVPPETFCTTPNCHGSDVAATHVKSTRGCTVCHAEGVTPSTTCSSCHSADLITVHTNATASHDITGNSCLGTGCHAGTDAAALHNAADGPGCVACHAVGETPTLARRVTPVRWTSSTRAPAGTTLRWARPASSPVAIRPT